jgi:hypothetical protein
LQEQVTYIVAERIINVLEAVKIQKHDRDLLIIAAGTQLRLLQSVPQQYPVWQACQVIIIGQLLAAREKSRIWRRWLGADIDQGVRSRQSTVLETS